MRSAALLLTCAAAAALLSSTRPALPQSPPVSTSAKTGSSQTAHQFEATEATAYRMNYLLFLPRAYDAEGTQRWPLLLFLHGAGERGHDLHKVAVHGPPKLVKEQPDFPFILVSPQCPENETWNTTALMKLLDHIITTHRVDPRRVYATGLSMGGYGTWELGIKYPERFAAIAPVCGGGNTIEVLLPRNSEALKTLAAWAFHGAKDETVPLAESERMIQVFKRAGVKEARLTVYPEANHDSWTETYKNPDLYTWLLAHQRGGP